MSPDVPRTADASTSPWRRDAAYIAVSLGLLAAWDLSGLDLSVARLFGNHAGFPLRNSGWALASYDAERMLAWAVVLVLAASLWVSVPRFRKVARSRRAWWLLTTLGCLALVPLLRSHSATSCPWSLTEFGGATPYVSHWWQQVDAGPGRCFPSGHASTGFAFVAGFFALRGVDRRLARRWLAAALAVGLLASLTQTVRGAHFVSHSMWTAWICWTVTAASWHATQGIARAAASRTRRESSMVVDGASTA